jgi:hypothetical protein
MERPTLLHHLAEVLAGQPRAVYAFRDLDVMSDDGLRNARASELMRMTSVEVDRASRSSGFHVRRFRILT